MITPEQRSKAERRLVCAFVLLGVALPMLAVRSPLDLLGWQGWLETVLIIAIPAGLTCAPVVVNLARRERVFTIGTIVAAAVFACLLFLATLLASAAVLRLPAPLLRAFLPLTNHH